MYEDRGQTHSTAHSFSCTIGFVDPWLSGLFVLWILCSIFFSLLIDLFCVIFASGYLFIWTLNEKIN